MKIKPSRSTAIRIAPLALLGLLIPVANAATVLNFPDFSDVSNLQINGNAAQVGNVMRIVPANTFQAGSFFSTTAVTLTADVSFSTFFSFRISSTTGTFGDGDGAGADGLVFVVQTNSNTVGSAGGGIGYSGVTNSLGIEFDTYDNGLGLGDPDGNHVAINTGGNLSPNNGVQSVTNRLNDGDLWYAWVDYDGTTDDLEVRLGNSATRPAAALLSTNVDLNTVLGGTNAFVGFTSATGSGFGDHDIVSWEFRDNYSPVVNPPTNPVPEGGRTLITLAIGLLGIALLRPAALRRCVATA
jgi:hypothetical protein